ncbi:MAG TPA: FAD-dependent oxidoreductase [Burkholderiales bacterium]|nr:FAD-dependent oxidoreductase [Burkholderiales bacterium]
MNTKKWLLLAAVAALVAAFFPFDLGRYLTLGFFKSQQQAIVAYVEANPLQSALLFFLLYVAVTGLSLPGAAIMTLVAGAAFGLLWGTVIVSFASSIGATLAFLASRFLLRELVRERFGDKLKTVNEGIAKDGAFYLFTLRLVPAFPFFLINLAMGLTPIAARTFYWVSQIGMLPGTLVYVNAGREIGAIESLRGILSPGLIISFTLLGIFPLIAKGFVRAIRKRQALRGWPTPRRFDCNLVVIGAGSAGLVAAYIAAAVKAKVTLIEKDRMGGDCLNTGCVPSKALIRTARLLADMKRSADLGIRSASAQFDFADVMERVQRVIRTVEPHDSVARYTALGVECLHGEAKITTPYTVEVKDAAGTRTLTTRAIVIAAGARPFVPPIPGIEEVGYLTSDTVWSLRELPRRLVVLGGGPIGCELTQCFARFGAQVTQVEMLPRLLIREDPEISARVLERFREEGIDVRVNHKAQRFALEAGEKVLYCESAGQEVRIAFDALLCAVGRVANTSGYGLEALGIPVSRSRTVEVNELMQTRYPNIYACGDVAGPYQFTHTAAHTAWYASVNALFGAFKTFRADFSVIPWCTFTDPEVARVGLNETEAKEKNIPYEVTTYDIGDLDRAIADEAAAGIVKVLTVPGKDRILGATIVGAHAGDLIAELILAMRHGIGLNQVLGTIHVYPTFAEATKYVAGNWKRAHAPQKLLAWVERYHAWKRGKA